MAFKLSTQEKEDIPYSLVKASSNGYLTVPDAKGVEASGSFGSLSFYEIECSSFNVWYHNYHTKQRTSIHGTCESPMLELHFTLNNTIHYKMEGLNEATLLQGQFNLSYAPFVNNVVWFQKDEVYTIFGIHFEPDYLRELTPHFPLLEEFLHNVDQRIACMISRYHGMLTPAMSEIIRNILHCPYSGDLKNLYMQSKVSELLLLALEQIGVTKTQGADIVLKPYDIEKINEAREYLLRNMDNPITLIELSHKVGINDFKLKRGFKQLYGTTVYEFLLDARMEKARTLLLETDTSVQEIAIITGYKNLSSFITAFKKKMGYSPGSFKRMKRNGR